MSNTETANRKKKKKQQQQQQQHLSVTLTPWRGAVVLLRIIGGGCVTRFSTSWPYFRPKHVIFHTRFKTWPLKSIPVFIPGGSHKTQHTCLRRQKLDHHYWDESANKKNIFLKIYFEFAQYGVMLFTGWEVRIVRNCARGLEYRPRP